MSNRTKQIRLADRFTASDRQSRQPVGRGIELDVTTPCKRYRLELSVRMVFESAGGEDITSSDRGDIAG